MPIARLRRDARERLRACLGQVFTEGHVSNPVQTALDGPVSMNEPASTTSSRPSSGPTDQRTPRPSTELCALHDAKHNASPSQAPFTEFVIPHLDRTNTFHLDAGLDRLGEYDKGEGVM
jgi:hypothetical protein